MEGGGSFRFCGRGFIGGLCIRQVGLRHQTSPHERERVECGSAASELGRRSFLAATARPAVCMRRGREQRRQGYAGGVGCDSWAISHVELRRGIPRRRGMLTGVAPGGRELHLEPCQSLGGGKARSGPPHVFQLSVPRSLIIQHAHR